MAFSKKTWVDRESEYPARRTLTPAGGGEGQLYEVERAEGTVLAEGDAFDAATMNDLEQRVEDGLAERVPKALHNGRNLLINGNFTIWQRGVSVTPTGAGFGPDHWRNYYTNVIYSRQTNSGPGNAMYMLRSTAASSNSQCLIRQKVELQPRNKGGVVLSLWVRCSRDGLNFQISNGINGYTNKPISTTWSYLTHYWPDGATQVDLRFSGAVSLGDFFEATCVKLEYADGEAGASAFVPPDPAEELLRCQRYYVRVPEAVGAYYNGPEGFHVDIPVPVEMYIVPSLPAATLSVSHGGVTTPVPVQEVKRYPTFIRIFLNMASAGYEPGSWLMVSGITGLSGELY